MAHGFDHKALDDAGSHQFKTAVTVAAPATAHSAWLQAFASLDVAQITQLDTELLLVTIGYKISSIDIAVSHHIVAITNSDVAAF